MKVVRKKVMMWWQLLKTMILMIMMMMMVLKHDMTFVAFHLHWFHRNLAENSQSLIVPTHPTLPKSSKYKTQIQMPIQIHINSANKIQQNTITNCTFQPTLLVLKIFAPTKILCPINHNSLSSNKKSHKLRRTKNKAGNFQSINNWIPMVWRYLGGSYLSL